MRRYHYPPFYFIYYRTQTTKLLSDRKLFLIRKRHTEIHKMYVKQINSVLFASVNINTV